MTPVNTDIVVMVLEIDGVRHVYGVPRSFIGARDPEDLTMGELSRFPALSGLALFFDFLGRRSADWDRKAGAP